jgi:hypothetical protein
LDRAFSSSRSDTSMSCYERLSEKLLNTTRRVAFLQCGEQPLVFETVKDLEEKTLRLPVVLDLVTDRVYSIALAVLVLMRILLNMNFVVQFPELATLMPHAPFGYWHIQWVGLFAAMTGVVRWNHIAFLYVGAAFVVAHVVLGSLCLASVISSNSDALHNFILPCLSIYLALDVPIMALYTWVLFEQHRLVSSVWRHAIWDWFAHLLCRAHPRTTHHQGPLDDPTPVPPFRFSSRMLASAMFTVFFAGVAVYRWQASLFALVQLILDQPYVVEFRKLRNIYSDMLESALSLLSQASNTACVICILIVVFYQLLLLRSFRRDVELALNQPHDDHVQTVLMHASIAKSPLFVMCTSIVVCGQHARSPSDVFCAVRLMSCFAIDR